MEIKNLDTNLSVSGQLELHHLRLLAEHGVKTIICNRPDDEERDQCSFAEITHEAEKLGITTAYLPVIQGSISDENSIAFRKLIREQAKPIHAYCRTGIRSTILWTKGIVFSQSRLTRYN